MKKRQEKHEEQELEVLKAVAQAWYSHSGNSRPMSEFDVRRRNFRGKPSRFKLEATSNRDTSPSLADSTYWDFQQSLWDTYELVTVSRRIETGLVMDNNPFDELGGSVMKGRRSKRESTNSLRNLFYSFSSSRRFNNDTKVPQEK